MDAAQPELSVGEKVWIDDSHPIFRRGLSACLTSAGFHVVGESAALSPAPRFDRVDLLVFEAVGSAVGHVARLRAGRATPLVATVHRVDDGEVCRLVEAGVAAVLPHAALTSDVLVRTLRAALSGVATLPADIVPRLLRHVRDSGVPLRGTLNDRERDVLRLLSEGSDTQEIALGLSFSERTVKNVVHDIMMKLNCRTRAHAVALATRSGVI